MPGFRGETCPYCFEKFRLHQAPFRCTTPGVRCAPERDEVRARLWEDGAPLGRVLPPGGRFAGSARCPACEQVTRRRLCPHCHMELPQTLGRFRNLIFAVIGAKEAGKSHYLAVLIEQLRKHVGPRLDLLLEPLDQRTIERYRREFYQPLYQDKRVINATVQAFVDNRVQMPLVYTLTFSGKNLWGKKCIKGVVTLVFFDTAGEDLDDLDTMKTVNKYIYRSDGLIVLLDPLQLDPVRARLAGAVELPKRNSDTADILTRTTRLIEEGLVLSPETLISIPIAVAFSKFDAVESLLDPQMQLNAAARHEGGYDLADFGAVNAEMHTLLTEWDSVVVLEQVSKRYRQAGFFGFSALGCHPGSAGQVRSIVPRRVEDPFLWLLHTHRLLPALKRA
jgi:hypothetical protein